MGLSPHTVIVPVHLLTWTAYLAARLFCLSSLEKRQPILCTRLLIIAAIFAFGALVPTFLLLVFFFFFPVPKDGDPVQRVFPFHSVASRDHERVWKRRVERALTERAAAKCDTCVRESRGAAAGFCWAQEVKHVLVHVFLFEGTSTCKQCSTVLNP